jgi:hypothetical protein
MVSRSPSSRGAAGSCSVTSTLLAFTISQMAEQAETSDIGRRVYTGEVCK